MNLQLSVSVFPSWTPMGEFYHQSLSLIFFSDQNVLYSPQVPSLPYPNLHCLKTLLLLLVFSLGHKGIFYVYFGTSRAEKSYWLEIRKSWNITMRMFIPSVNQPNCCFLLCINEKKRPLIVLPLELGSLIKIKAYDVEAVCNMNSVIFVCFIFLVGIIAVRFVFFTVANCAKLKQTGGKHAILFVLHRHFFSALHLCKQKIIVSYI